MKEQNTSVKYTRSEIDTHPDETDWERVDALTDEDIDAAASSDPDAPPTDASFWKDATVVMPENMIIVDPDLLAWFKAPYPRLRSANQRSAPVACRGEWQLEGIWWRAESDEKVSSL